MHASLPCMTVQNEIKRIYIYIYASKLCLFLKKDTRNETNDSSNKAACNLKKMIKEIFEKKFVKDTNSRMLHVCYHTLRYAIGT
jgi:hypothetical protein